MPHLLRRNQDRRLFLFFQAHRRVHHLRLFRALRLYRLLRVPTHLLRVWGNKGSKSSRVTHMRETISGAPLRVRGTT